MPETAACSVYCRLKAVTILVDEDARARARANLVLSHIAIRWNDRIA